MLVHENRGDEEMSAYVFREPPVGMTIENDHGLVSSITYTSVLPTYR